MLFESKKKVSSHLNNDGKIVCDMEDIAVDSRYIAVIYNTINDVAQQWQR